MRKAVFFRSAFLFLFALGVVLMATGCGGGFKGDSPNAVEIENAVFGGDSL